jgi:hypothetical protein
MMLWKKGLLILASVSVIVACATAAWSSPTTDPNTSTPSRGLRLLVSDSANRLNAKKLQGAGLREKVAIFTNRPSNVRSVAFYLDDPKMQTRPRHIEYSWPFDFVGTARGGTAKLFDTSKLAAGRHVVTAKAVLTNGAKIFSSAAFYKKKVRTAPTPTPTATPTTIQPRPLPQPAVTASQTTTAPQPVDLPTQSISPSTSATASAPRTTAGCSAQPNTPGGSDGVGGCFPGPGNTGIPAGTTLTAYTGPCTITAANTVIDSKTINCDLEVEAPGLVVRKSRLNGNIANAEGSNNSYRVEDSYIDASPNGPRAARGIQTTHYTVVRSEIVGGNSGGYCQLDCTLQDSWIHGTELDPNSLWHASALRVEQGSNLIHNTLACDYMGPFNNDEIGCSADMTGYPDFAPINHNTIDGNLFIANPSGAGFCAYGGGTGTKPYSNDSLNAKYIVFRNNVFQRGSNGKCGTYGPVTDFISTRTGNVWDNNRWSDGATVPPG